MIDVIATAKGLVKQYNPLTTQPGALSKADNCVIRRENIIEPRRGYEAEINSLPNKVVSMWSFNDALLYSNSSLRVYRYRGGFVSEYTGLTGTGWLDVNFTGVQAAQNCYVNAGDGVKAIEDVIVGTFRNAGAPRSLDSSYTLTSGAAGFLADGTQCAYRTLIKRTDTNKNVLFGYPSERLWVTNSSGGAENVNLTTTLANDVREGDVIQIYRTTQIAGVSSDSSGDECGLVYEYTITASDVTNGSVSFTDSITDTLIGADLYTNPSQEGIAQGNTKPPASKHLALYKSNYMFFGNTRTPHQLSFSLVGTSGLTGNTLTIAGTTYNFGATEIISGGGSPQVAVSSTGVAAFDIDQTAKSLVRVINRYAANTSVYAYYLSGPDDLPGNILLQVQDQSTATFTIQGNNTTIAPMIFPEAPVAPATSTALTSTNDERVNGLYYSKNQQFEAVPLLNYLPIGPGNSAILKLAPLRDSLIIITETGVFRLTGEDPQSFTVTTIDDTLRCKAPETVAVLSNQVIMLSNQGVVRISENGVEVISREIEVVINKVLNTEDFEDTTRGFAYESERQYFLSFLGEGESAAFGPTETYVYNLFTRTWTRWTFGMEAAEVQEQDDILYHADKRNNIIYKERKTFTDEDYADPASANFIQSVSGDKATVTGFEPVVGDMVESGSFKVPIKEVIENPDGPGWVITLVDGIEDTFTSLPAGVSRFPSVGMDVEYMAWTAKNPAAMKQVRSVAVLADDTEEQNSVTGLNMKFKSNFCRTQETVPIERASGGWGDAFGSFGFGGVGDTFGYPTYVPRNKQYCNRLYMGVEHRNAKEKLSIAGMAFEFEMVSEEVGT